ncbi:hypothetical protein J2755_000277 [Methanohalophilus levihalophilus]|uniref:rolling circle replication-associated protein n=1 Tax=Methanohalophilus levihalophilus TaxID=1431282 RepID=UPI001AE48389|nr:hypothetical protein [Methanohalophilus levihalophilus]MBP2029357.1 hypothetical protein [Methanohalophilus levihalophilus]
MKPSGIGYYQIYRFLRTERGQSLFVTKKDDGLLMIRTRPEALDLIPRKAGDTQISNTLQNDEEIDSRREKAISDRLAKMRKRIQPEDIDLRKFIIKLEKSLETLSDEFALAEIEEKERELKIPLKEIYDLQSRTFDLNAIEKPTTEEAKEIIKDLEKRIKGMSFYHAIKAIEDTEQILGIASKHKYGKTGPERYQAIGYTLDNIDIRPVQKKIGKLFDEYLGRTEGAQILLQPDPVQDLYGPCIELDYKTRFTDESRKKQEIAKYLKIWEQAEQTESWNNAVLLTLTTDPKRQPNLWVANKKISKNFNRFISFLTRRLQAKRAKREGVPVREIPANRPPYLCVYEFQQNGRLHLHIVFFGISYLIKKQEMIDLWKKYAQGEIVDFKKLRYDKSSGSFEWQGSRPTDCKQGEKPHTYLKKYVIKNLYDESASGQYWIYNTRFYTYSRKYFLGLTFKRTSRGLYVFLGVFYDGAPPMMASRPGHVLGKGYPIPAPPPDPEPHVQVMNDLCKRGTGAGFRTAYEIINVQLRQETDRLNNIGGKCNYEPN